MKHEVIQISSKIDEMKKLIEEMVHEVEKADQSISVNEEVYNKLEMKVRKKFNEEVDKLEKSFRRMVACIVIDKNQHTLTNSHGNFTRNLAMMKSQLYFSD